MKSLTLDISKAMLKPYELEYMAEQVKTAGRMLHSKEGAGSDFLGWVDLPVKGSRRD
ncbi:MAG: Glucose-6-phosphate isomerase [Clostridia bacterium]|nr:Glucose-6-phosphate isomerase [Clostridia bacterium]